MPTPTIQSRSICFAPLTNGVSGTERVVADLIRTLHTKNMPVSLVLPAGENLSSFGESLQPYVTHYQQIGAVVGKRAVGRNLLSAFRLFSTWRPAIVHFHCPHYRWGLDVVLAAHLARVPYILRTEQNPLMSPPDRLAGTLLRLTDARVTAFTYVSKGNQQRFETLLPYRVGRGRVIANGIDPARFSATHNTITPAKLRAMFNFPADSKIAVYVGSFGDRRSLRPIFEAFQRLLADPVSADLARQWNILVIGVGPDEERALPAQLGIDTHVHFAGRRQDVADILPSCDLFISASAYEGLSIALLEAWGVGLPVLATQVDGIADVIGEEWYRQLMVPQNNMVDYARAWLYSMRGNAEWRAIHAQASVEVRTRFTTTLMLDDYLQLYAQTLGLPTPQSKELTETRIAIEQKVNRLG